MRKKYKAIFISPHLDDAVFSCGGTITKLIVEGSVLVLNIFTTYYENKKRGPIVLDKSRYQEEKDASAYIGFISDSLNEPDAFFRRKAYQSPARLFDHINVKDIPYITQLSEKIKQYLCDIDYDLLYVPLGIGWHVDHILCFLAMDSFLIEKNLFLYEDSPYCLIPNATRYRLNELGLILSTENDSTITERFFLGEWYDSALYYAKMAPIKNLRLPFRLIANMVVSAYLFKLMLRHRFFQKGAKTISFKPFLSNVTEYFNSKIEAICLYKSQFKEFFLDRVNCESLYKGYSCKISENGDLYERFWKIC